MTRFYALGVALVLLVGCASSKSSSPTTTTTPSDAVVSQIRDIAKDYCSAHTAQTVEDWINRLLATASTNTASPSFINAVQISVNQQC